MREILFRGKRTDNGEWIEGLLLKGTFYYDDREILTIVPVDNVFYPRCEISSYEEVIPETVGQWTGLLDKNGKKIFEGDILDTPRWIVSYCADTNAGLGMNAGWYIQRDNFTSWLELENSEWHVVLGNIHDNPELLKSSTQVTIFVDILIGKEKGERYEKSIIQG